MKKAIQVQEVEGEGLMAFMGEKVMLLCANYIYAGKLTGVNDLCVLLEEAEVVFDTGTLQEPNYKVKEKFPQGKVYVMLGAIEAFTHSK